MSSQQVDVESIAPMTDADHRDMEESLPSAGASLLLLKAQDAEMLAQSTGFNILREHLAQMYDYNLCDEHSFFEETVHEFLLARDVLHALLVPVVELFDRSVTLAEAATHATSIEDLEYAFSGQARNAFVWLQCYLSSSKERDWCYTKGCSACVLKHTLDSEFSVRLLVAACLLSDVHYPFTLEGPTLPSFMFFLESIQEALAGDPLYGSDFFEIVKPKAVATRNGIEELIHQCVELDGLLSRSSTPSNQSAASSAASSAHVSPVLKPCGTSPSSGRLAMKVSRGKMARRQMSMQIEEEQWIEQMLDRCENELRATEDDALGAGAESGLEADAKLEPVVSVSEVKTAG